MPLNDPVGSNAADVLVRNASDLDKIVNSHDYQVQNRTGAYDRTIYGINSDASNQISRIGFEQPVAYNTTGQTLLRVTQTVTNGGLIYAPAFGTVFPFVTSGAFNLSLWRVVSTADAGTIIGLTQIKKVSDLIAFVPTYNNQIVNVLSFSIAGDNAGGLWYYDSSSTSTSDGFLVSSCGSTGRMLRIVSDSILASWFGCSSANLTGNSSAINNAIKSAKDFKIKKVILPSGDIILDGIYSADSFLNGIYVPFKSLGQTPENKVVISGYGTKLLAGSNNMIMARLSSDFSMLEGVTLDGNGKTGVWGIGIVPDNMAQTTSLVSQQFCSMLDVNINGVDEGLVLQGGPSIGGSDSGSYYHSFSNIQSNNCKRHIWLKESPTSNGTLNTRNNFYSWKMLRGNTGVQIDAGDTNSFFGHSAELIAGIGPNGTAVAYKVKQKPNSTTTYYNVNNRFFGCTEEACTISWDRNIAVVEVGGLFLSPASPNDIADSQITLSNAFVGSGELTSEKSINAVNSGGLARIVKKVGVGGAALQGQSSQPIDVSHWDNSAKIETLRLRFMGDGTELLGKSDVSVASNGFERYPSGYERRLRPANSIMTEFVNTSAPSVVGSITITGTSTSYNTTSDYRLKNVLGPYLGGLDLINKIKIHSYEWKNGGLNDIGVLAHELQEIKPSAVFGKKDALTNEGEVIPQVVDYSRLVSDLVQAVQTLTKRINALELM